MSGDTMGDLQDSDAPLQTADQTEKPSLGVDNAAFDASESNNHALTRHVSRKAGINVVFRNVKITINKKDILKNVSGIARQGELLAVMGPSGAGKSTLLNSIAGRQEISGGSVSLNGSPVTRRMRRKICYVVQSDIFFPNLTVLETLTFTAYLRLPDTMPKRMKRQRVEDIITTLDLEKCKNTVMGGVFLPGISGGEKKRASIACELLTNPQILILDEPTSGLDAAIALSLMSSLRKYTQRFSKTVITTIHQPSTQIFNMFDNVLLLANGETAYFGDVDKIMDFFRNIGLHCELHYNPADFILEKVKESEETVKKIIESAYELREQDSWPIELREEAAGDSISAQAPSYSEETPAKINGKKHSLNQKQLSKTDSVVGLSYKPNAEISTDEVHIDLSSHTSDYDLDIDSYVIEGAKFQTSFWTQYTSLTGRNLIQARSRILSKLSIIQTTLIAILAGLIWFDTARTEQTADDRLGMLYFLTTYFFIIAMFDILVSFPDERGVITKERNAGSYRLSSYFFAKMTTEIPLMLILPTAYILVFYWMSNLSRTAHQFFYILLLLYLKMFAGQSVGLLIGVSVTDFRISITTASVFSLFSSLTGGFYSSNLPNWIIWIQYLSLTKYSFSAMVKVEFLLGEPLQCNPVNTTAFLECRSANSTLPGESFVRSRNFDSQLWFDVMMMTVFFVIFRILAYLVLRFIRRPKSVR